MDVWLQKEYVLLTYVLTQSTVFTYLDQVKKVCLSLIINDRAL